MTEKNPAPGWRGVLLWVSLDLGANVGRSRTLGTGLSRKTDLGAGIQTIEINAAAAVEEVVVAVFRGDKPESALGDELLDSSRHLVWTSFPERTASRCRGLFERGPRRAHPGRVHPLLYPDKHQLKHALGFPPGYSRLMITNFPTFVGIALLVILSPGQDTALTIRNTLVGGRAGGIATAAGVVSGLAAWTVASRGGVAALLVASQPLFLAIRLIGAAYLIFLGLQALRAASFQRSRQADGTTVAPRARLRRMAAYRQGGVSKPRQPQNRLFFLHPFF